LCATTCRLQIPTAGTPKAIQGFPVPANSAAPSRPFATDQARPENFISHRLAAAPGGQKKVLPGKSSCRSSPCKSAERSAFHSGPSGTNVRNSQGEFSSPPDEKCSTRGSARALLPGRPSFASFFWTSKKRKTPGWAGPAEVTEVPGVAPRRRLTLIACPKRVSRKRAPRCCRPLARVPSARQTFRRRAKTRQSPRTFARLFHETSAALRRRQRGDGSPLEFPDEPKKSPRRSGGMDAIHVATIMDDPPPGSPSRRSGRRWSRRAAA